MFLQSWLRPMFLGRCIVVIFCLLELATVSLAETVKCPFCNGEACRDNVKTCKNGYCAVGEFKPQFGVQAKYDKQKDGDYVVKGCVNGNGIENDIKPHCEDGEGGVCFCDGGQCSKKALDKLEVEPFEYVECRCRGKHCGRKDTCIGQFCSHVINSKTKEEEKGCVNFTVPLVERRAVGMCSMPPMFTSTFHTLAKDPKDFGNLVSCVCDGEMCNKPSLVGEEIPYEDEECPVFVELEMSGLKTTHNPTGKCNGQHCFRTKVGSRSSETQAFAANITGCASYIEDAKLPEEMTYGACAKFENDDFIAEGCLQTDPAGKAAKHARSLDKYEGPRKSPKKSRKGKKVEDEEEEEEDEEEDERPKSRKPTKTEKEEEKEEEVEEKEGKKEDVKSSTPRVVFIRPTEPEAPDESNVTMITIFVLIILCICVAGITWKFQLHRKLIRGNYDTVAGG